MRAAQTKPLAPSTAPATGPQLVPARKKDPTEASVEKTDRGSPPPFVTVVTVAVIAFTLAFTFFSSIMLWVWYRTTGVNWMFQR
jgi:hypothetical protein